MSGSAVRERYVQGFPFELQVEWLFCGVQSRVCGLHIFWSYMNCGHASSYLQNADFIGLR
jgi:hypothetical protein